MSILGKPTLTGLFDFSGSGPIVSFPYGDGSPLKSLVAHIEPVQEGTGDPSPDNVRPISGWSAVNVWVQPDYDPTANPTATLQLGDTIYGGTLDVKNGVLTVDRVLKTCVGSDVIGASSGNGYGMMVLGEYGYIIDNYEVCNVLKDSSAPIAQFPNFSIRTLNSTGYNRAQIVFKFNFTSSTATEQKQKYINKLDELNAAGTPMQVVYKLATPVTYQLTPQQVNTLIGENNVWADTGDVDVEYSRKTFGFLSSV